MQTWKFNNFQSAAADNNYVLQGFGASLSWLGPYNIQIKGTWAQRTGNLPSGISQVLTAGSGGLSSNRYWLMASIPLWSSWFFLYNPEMLTALTIAPPLESDHV